MLEARAIVCPEERGNLIGGLKKQIDEAYKNRVIQTIKTTKDGKSSVEREEDQLDTNRKIKNFATNRGIPIEDIILNAGSEFFPGAVYVDNFDDFRDLLKLSFEKLVKEGMFRKCGRVHQEILEAELHERQHFIRARQYNIPTRFGVQFIENKENGKVGFRAFVDLIGEFSVKLYRDIATAPILPSQLDKIIGNIGN